MTQASQSLPVADAETIVAEPVAEEAAEEKPARASRRRRSAAEAENSEPKLTSTVAETADDGERRRQTQEGRLVAKARLLLNRRSFLDNISPAVSCGRRFSFGGSYFNQTCMRSRASFISSSEPAYEKRMVLWPSSGSKSLPGVAATCISDSIDLQNCMESLVKRLAST